MKMKRFAALAAVMMLGIQLVGVGAAWATAPTNPSDCDFGRNDLEITLGEAGNNNDAANVDLFIKADGKLYCDPVGKSVVSQPVSSIDSITVEMDNEDSDGELTIWLQNDKTSSATAAAEWPEFDTFDINVSTVLHFDGGDVGTTSARDAVSISVGPKAIEFGGTTANFSAFSLDIVTGGSNDTIDASKATVAVAVDAGAGKDVVKGGTKNDDLTGGGDGDVLYGNAGNDDLDCGGGTDAGWGGDGLDYIKDCETAAPGAGDDEVDGALSVTYVDLKDGIEWIDGSTDGAAGDDDFAGSTSIAKLSGSQGADVIVDTQQDLATIYGNGGNDAVKVSYDASDKGATVYGGAGNDVIVALDASYDYSGDTYTAFTAKETFYGGSGNDVLKGKGGDDLLNGGPGSDQAWGGGGKDTCGAEVTNRCEYVKKASI